MASLWMLLLGIPLYVFDGLYLRLLCACFGYKVNMENPKAGRYIQFMMHHPFVYMVRELIAALQYIWTERPMKPIDATSEYMMRHDERLGLPENYQNLIK